MLILDQTLGCFASFLYASALIGINISLRFLRKFQSQCRAGTAIQLDYPWIEARPVRISAD